MQNIKRTGIKLVRHCWTPWEETIRFKLRVILTFEKSQTTMRCTRFLNGMTQFGKDISSPNDFINLMQF